MRNMKSRVMRPQRKAQGGVMLLEALIGLLIFSIGVLSLVAMQSVAISNVSNAKYRVEAAFYAEEIMNRMWMDSGTQLTTVDKYKYPGGNSPYLMAWVGRLQSATGLPNAFTYPPTIEIRPADYQYDSIVSSTATATTTVAVRQVIVTIRWKAPDALTPSNHQAIGWITEQ